MTPENPQQPAEQSAAETTETTTPPSPVTPEEELDFSDQPEKPAEPKEVAAITETPTVGQQAEFLLQAPEGEKLSERDREFLAQVARDMQEVEGVLHRNPDGSYAPLNDPDGSDRKVDSSDGERVVSAGYRFKDDSTEYAFTTEPELKYTNANLTDEIVKLIMKRDPRWARQNVMRGWYEKDDKYWNKA